MTGRQFRYLSKDVAELPVKLHHLTIFLNFMNDRVEAVNCMEMTPIYPMDAINLDANSLEILRVEWLEDGSVALGKGQNLDFDYLRDEARLKVRLPRRVSAGERFWVRTHTNCFPSDTVLEGIYRDSTPPGAPQQYMSQCQQWGFQRIMPIFDDCRAKCTMTTTLEADAAYTHIISNGNVRRLSNPDGTPILKPGQPGRKIITYENTIPMAPYLFIACAGTWDELAHSVTYPSGRTVRLEYLVPPGRVKEVQIPMEILRDSILWIERAQDYEYTGDTYRTICMNKSNFGGMENAGNTTIVTDAALIDEHTLDTALLYAHAVIVHEFEHNQCGSETTMESPFDVWLNEAYTVDVERQFMADTFEPSFVRLNQVESIRNPLLGPLAIEDGGHAGKIVRDGFNDPDELIDGVTYVKAAEVIRMLRLVLGAEAFKKGKALYFSRYRNGNANTDQFFQCFEEVSERSLSQFRKGWLHTIGYPKVTASSLYDSQNKRYTVKFRQEQDNTVFHLPIELALVDRLGKDITGTDRVFQLMEKEAELTFPNIQEPPAFASINRDYSFYGTFHSKDESTESLILQARLDANACNRVNAMRQLTDLQRIRLMLHPDAEIDGWWLELYGEILADMKLPPALKAYFLTIDEQPVDREYSTWYPEQVSAREKLMTAVNGLYHDTLLHQFEALDTYSPQRRKSPKDGIEERMLKQVLLALTVIDDTPACHGLILKHFEAATTATDRVGALMALNRSSAPIRRTVLEEAYRSWHPHLSGYANYLRVVSSGTREDVFDMIALEKHRPSFDVTQPTWNRALLLPMAANNKMLWTDQGIQWLANTVVELAPVNSTTTSRLLNAFQHVKRLKPGLKEKVVAALERIARGVTDDVSPTVSGQVRAYVAGI